MKPKTMLLAAFFVWWSLAVYPQSAENAGKSFHISSRGTTYGVQGEFGGTYRVLDDYIEVKLSRATIYVSEHCPYQGSRVISYFKFGMGVEISPDGKWDIESSAQPHYLERVMTPKEEYSLSDVSFLIPKERAIDLSKRWFIVEIQTDALDLPREKNTRGYVYAFSCKDIFQSPGGETSRR